MTPTIPQALAEEIIGRCWRLAFGTRLDEDKAQEAFREVFDGIAGEFGEALSLKADAVAQETAATEARDKALRLHGAANKALKEAQASYEQMLAPPMPGAEPAPEEAAPTIRSRGRSGVLCA